MSNLNLNITEQQLPIIAFNFEEIKEAVKMILADYSGLIVTEDNLSLCKQNQKDLAGMRVKIDTYRKDTKKEMAKPIDEFENKCKELVKLVEDAEKPLKEGIQVFDDKKREEKRQAALGIIKAAIEEHGLKPKYSDQLTVADKYCNLSAKASDIRDDVEQRVFILLQEQQKEEEMLELIQDAIDNANKTIKAQMQFSDFQRLLDRGMSTKDVIAEINHRAEQIRKAENPPPEPQKAEQTVELIPTTPSQSAGESAEPIKKDESLYFVELRFVETREQIGKLSELLKYNGYNYTVIKKGKVE